MELLHGFHMFGNIERFYKYVDNLFYYKNMSEIHNISDMNFVNKMIPYINMFGVEMVDIVLRIIDRRF
jgi:hypothetical protein